MRFLRVFDGIYSMKALYFHRHGTLENLSYGDLEDPRPAAGEVLVRVRACALNHLDLWVLRGWKGLELPMPTIGGADIAGVIVEIGPDVQGGKIGDRIVVQPGFVPLDATDEWIIRGEESVSPHYKIFGENRHGGFADYVCVPAYCVFPLPDEMSFEEGAAPLLVGLTAWRMLKVRARLAPAEVVLIIGAGGGVNSISIQLAKLFGAQVIAVTSSEAKAEKAAALGADAVINRLTTPDWSKEVKGLTHGRGVDLVLDNVGENTMTDSLRAVRRGGKILTVGNTSGPTLSLDNRLIFSKQISIIGSTMGSTKDFRDMLQFVWDAKLKPVIDRTLPLKDGRQGYSLLEAGEQFGKIVLVPEE